MTLAVRLAPARSAPDRGIDALVAAVNGTRYIEPRLTGGFPGGPVRVQARKADGAPDRGTASFSSRNLDLIAAVAATQKRLQAQPSPAHLHATGVGLLLLGSIDDAIDSLEGAAAVPAGDAAIVSDLAAAYAARAAATRSADDWSNALDRSEHALRLDPSLLEAAFNSALALEALRLDGARAAWQAYLARDNSSDWASEARDRLMKLNAIPEGSRRRDNDAAIRAALDGGSDAALALAARRDPQRTREWLEEELSSEWSGAVLTRDAARESRARERAQRLLVAYATASSDGLPADALPQLWSITSGRESIATAIARFAEAARLVREDRLPESTAIVGKALPALQSINSPLALWARYFIVLDWSQQGRLADCLAELNRLQAAIGTHDYPVLAGTIRNRRGQILGRQGYQEGAIRERIAAIKDFEKANDADQIAVMHSMVAEAYRFLGDTRTAWLHHGESLQRLAATPNYRSRHLVIVQAGLTATHDGRFDAAIAFQRQVVENGHEWQRASGTATGYLHQARNASRLGNFDAAESAIRDARALVGDIPDAAFRDRIELELLEVEGELFGHRDPAAALPVLTSAVDRFTQQGFALRLANLLLWRGRVHQRAGDAAAAEADWQRAVESLERERALVSAESLRLAQAGSLRALDTEIAFARLRANRPAAESLEPIERGRARTLVEDALGAARAPIAPGMLQLQLDDRTAVIHYAIDREDAVAWLTTRDRVMAVPLPLNGSALLALIDRHRRLVDRGASPVALRDTGRQLYRVLIEPFGPSIADRSSLIVVPDPALAGIAFGALINPATNAYLIESTSIAMAPSGALLGEAAAIADGGVLLIGADRPEGLPLLPGVTQEIERLAALHEHATVLTGAAATRERLFAEAPRASLIHFAGHAFGNAANPLMSRLVLHRGADDRADLYAYELSQLDVSGAIVVLAACETGYAGAGTRDDDGVLAMARPFLARGARAVLATYREVPDSDAPALMEEFHRQLKSGLAPAMAWQAAATTALRSRADSAAWMSYAVFLGRGSLNQTPAKHITRQTSGGR